jgi:5-methyltetrahydrofolate--homocysteine methyltransferase
MRGPETLCMDTYDYPDEIAAAMVPIRAAYRPVYDALFEAGRMDARGSIGWTSFYCEGRFATIQCDVIAMLSPEEFRRTVRPALEEEAGFLDRCVFHLDGKDALRHLDDILSIEAIDVIQWVPGAGQPRTVEWMDVLQKIQKAGKGLHLYDWHNEEIKRYRKDLKPEGLMFQTWAQTPAEADGLLEFLRKDM